MDIDNQIGAISATFWSQIKSTAENDIFVQKIKNVIDITKQVNKEHIVIGSEKQKSNEGQTLCEMVDETLQQGKQRNLEDSKRERRKNSIQQQESGSEKENSSKDSHILQEQEQQKQQSFDRDEKAVQRKRANNKNKKWSEEDLQKFFDLLECFGTDFTTIQQFLNKKTVTQIKVILKTLQKVSIQTQKNKFHKEEKDNPKRIRDLLLCKSSNKKLSIKLENERDIQMIDKHYKEKFLHSNLAFKIHHPAIGNSVKLETDVLSPSMSILSTLPLSISLQSESMKLVAEDIERRILIEKYNTN